MKFTVYPTDGYNSYVSEDTADAYFEFRLDSSEWDSCTEKEAALVTAFNMINEIENLTIDPTATAQLMTLQAAQMEQALWILKVAPGGAAASVGNVNLGGLLNVKFNQPTDEDSELYSPRVMKLLAAYIGTVPAASTISRTR